MYANRKGRLAVVAAGADRNAAVTGLLNSYAVVAYFQRCKGIDQPEVQQERVHPAPKMASIMTEKLIDRNPEILGGTPVFAGTRVPVRILMDHLEAGDRLEEFLDDFPTVTREQAIALLERATTMVLSDSIEAAA